ncbi:MAG: 6-phosphofructokinase [Phycisphaerales bacterium]
MPAHVLEGNAVIGQGGGPTAVINQSLVGVVEGLLAAPEIGAIYGARHGVRGMIENRFTELQNLPQHTLDRLAQTPSAGLGSTRDKPDADYCQKIYEALREKNVRYFFYIGGNDSSDTCRLVNEAAKAGDYELRCFHIPKTVDNDLMENDHTPGYASAARYVALQHMGDSLDNASIPGIKINVVMGRHAGFLTGAAALARTHEDDGPHLIYVPERAFDLDAFCADVDKVYSKLGRCQITVSEGIQDADHTPITTKFFQGETDAHGNVQLSGAGALGDQLSAYLKEKLTPQGGKAPRVRADTLGYAQRCWPDASRVDQREAREAGRFGARCALMGQTDGSIAIKREASGPYRARLERVELTSVAAKTRHLPDEHINASGNHMTESFVEWLRPLVDELPRFERI